MTSPPTDLVEEMPCGVMSFTDDGDVLYANPKVHDMLGYQPGELAGQRLQRIISVASRVFLQTHLCPLLRTKGLAEEVYIPVLKKDGTSCPVLLNARRRAADSGFLTICAVIKIEKRDQFEDEIIRMRNELRETNEKLMESLEQISRISAFDELTNLPNRRALMARLEQERMRAKRTGEIFSVAMIDLDHFKQINDTYGHHVGDEVLKLFSTRASHAMREVDLFGRYGGEEFLAILTGTGGNAAASTVKRVLAIAAAGNYSAIAEGLTVSASAGVATLDEKISVDHLLERADKVLYEAKRAGRNRVVQA